MTTAADGFDRRARTAQTRCERIDLDDVDLSRQVAGDFEADFLLTNCGLGPGLHDGSSLKCDKLLYRKSAPPRAPH